MMKLQGLSKQAVEESQALAKTLTFILKSNQLKNSNFSKNQETT